MTGAAAILQPRGKCRRMKGKTPNSTEKEDRKNLQLWRYRWGANQTNSTNQSPLHLLHEELYPNLSHYWASLIAQLVNNLPAMQETLVQFLGQEDVLEKGQATHSSILGLPLWLSWQRIHLQCRRSGFDPWVGKIPGEGKGYQLQYSGLENSMDCIVHGVAKSRRQLSNFYFLTF